MGARSRFFAFTYDRFSRGSEEAGLAEMRRNLIAGASGDVLDTPSSRARAGSARRGVTPWFSR